MNYGDEDILKQTLTDVNDEQKMLVGFGNKLNQK